MNSGEDIRQEIIGKLRQVAKWQEEVLRIYNEILSDLELGESPQKRCGKKKKKKDNKPGSNPGNG